MCLHLEEGEDYVPTSSNVPNDSNSYKYMFPFQHSDTLAFLFFIFETVNKATLCSLLQ
jgi:hypothetical protein